MINNIRVRFAPSPTGALHIGGVRTALYNYLLAKKYNGTFILRLEDTDQTRFVAGAEQYIVESLKWMGIEPTEGPGYGGEYGPYRQSERKDLYLHYAQELVKNGFAYLAFDTVEEMEIMRENLSTPENPTPMYGYKTRNDMKNGLTLSTEEVKALRDSGALFTIRMKVDPGEIIKFQDIVRGDVSFDSGELDDKVILKADGMPTYHFANVVDDYAMKITHVIRGEEWLSSTAHHVLLYKYLGWEKSMPYFSHLPLILKPEGSGKLSKRDGAKFGFPVFPLSWKAEKEEESFVGFREAGFNPDALINFLALLGWNPGDEREIISIFEMIDLFSLEKVGKSSARFDIDKAKWFNQQYIKDEANEEIAKKVSTLFEGHDFDQAYLTKVCGALKERCTTYLDFVDGAKYFFDDKFDIDIDSMTKKWKPEKAEDLGQASLALLEEDFNDPSSIEIKIKSYMNSKGFSPGELLPFLRIAMTGTLKGPDLFQTIWILGLNKYKERVQKLIAIMTH